MKRGGFIQRKTPMRRRRKISMAGSQLVATATKESVERQQWLHRQPCLWGRLIADPCSPGGVDECHVNEDKGIGLKSKHPTFPCCRKHHEIADGQARHQTVIPLEQMKMRALLMLMSWWTERDWQDVVTHEQRRESL